MPEPIETGPPPVLEPHRWMHITRGRPFSTVTCRCGWTHTDLGARRSFKRWAMHVRGITGGPERPVWRQAWFWTKDWQEGEMESEAEYRAGDYETFTSAEDFLAWLDQGDEK